MSKSNLVGVNNGELEDTELTMAELEKSTEVRMDVGIVLRHGGIVVIENGEYIYKGGVAEPEIDFEEDCLSILEVLWEIWALGYKQCGPLYCKYRENGKLMRLVKDVDLTAYVAACGDDEEMVIYVDSPFDDLNMWERVGDGERGAHEKSGATAKVGAMCISREPKEGVFLSTTETEGRETLYGGEVKDTVPEVDSDEADLDEGESGEESESGEDSDSDSDGSFEGLEDELEDTDASDVELLEEKRRHKEESIKRKRDANKLTPVELGPVGIDLGFDSFINEGNNYGDLLAGEEEYIGSSDIDNLPSCDEENEDYEEAVIDRRRKKKSVYYDPNCTEPVWELGMIFKNAEQLRDAIIYYAVKKQVHIKFKRNTDKKIRVCCKGIDKKDNSQCPWLIYGSIDKRSGNLVIKNYQPVHKCLKQHTNHHCNTKFISKFLREDIIKTPNIKPWVMQATLKEKLSVYKNRSTCRRARDMVVNEITGDYKEEFRRLYDYRDIILNTNPGSTCEVEVESDNTFKAFYICFHALKEGWRKGCRKFIGVDGCFLKGAFKGQLLVAVGKNGNNEIYPVAWAVVHNETTESWTWFLQLLRQDLNLGKGKGLALMTDMQKGLENAIVEVLPEAEHRECARHIIANWSKEWRGVQRRRCFWRCAKSTFEAELKKNLLAMEEFGGRKIVNDLLRYNITRWSRRFFSDETSCDSVDNNVSETFNSMIIGARYKSIVSMLEDIRIETVKRHVKFKSFTEKWRTDISPMAYKILEKNNSRAMKCSILWNGDKGFEVLEGDWRYVVTLHDSTCSCRSWKLKGIPCCHAIAAMHESGLDPVKFVSHWYHKDTYNQAYSDFIQPMPNLKMIPESSHPAILAPLVRPLPGRPKKNRKKPEYELKKFGKASKVGVTMTCSWCKQPEHNKRNCPVRKEGKPPVIIEKVVQSSKGSNSTTSAKKRTQPKDVGSSRKKSKTGEMASGYGVFISETTGLTIEQKGKHGLTRVLRSARGTIRDSTVVTGDLGYNPTRTKWKGKEVVTQDDLLATRSRKQKDKVNQNQVKATQATKAQRERAAANKELAQKRLASYNKKSQGSSQPTQRMTRSSQANMSNSQPNPTPLWKI